MTITNFVEHTQTTFVRRCYAFAFASTVFTHLPFLHFILNANKAAKAVPTCVYVSLFVAEWLIQKCERNKSRATNPPIYSQMNHLLWSGWNFTCFWCSCCWYKCQGEMCARAFAPDFDPRWREIVVSHLSLSLSLMGRENPTDVRHSTFYVIPPSKV